MQITLSTATNVERTIQKALAKTNTKYRKNPIRLNDFVKKSKRRLQFTLRCTKSAYIVPARVSPNGTHTRAVSWQAHRGFMRNLLELDKNAVINTSIEKYEGLMGFIKKYPDTYGYNVGSTINPVAIGDLAVAAAA